MELEVERVGVGHGGGGGAPGVGGGGEEGWISRDFGEAAVGEEEARRLVVVWQI